MPLGPHPRATALALRLGTARVALVTADRIVRTTARVLPVRADGRVLLLHGHDPSRPDEPYWFTIGGGMEDGESVREAAARELREETGIVVPPEALGEPFLEGRHDYTYDGIEFTSHASFFAVALDGDVSVTFAGIEPGEHITDSGWWASDELDGAAVSNLQLPTIVRLAVGHVQG